MEEKSEMKREKGRERKRESERKKRVCVIRVETQKDERRL